MVVLKNIVSLFGNTIGVYLLFWLRFVLFNGPFYYEVRSTLLFRYHSQNLHCVKISHSGEPNGSWSRAFA